jgi:hypothetical protein
MIVAMARFYRPASRSVVFGSGAAVNVTSSLERTGVKSSRRACMPTEARHMALAEIDPGSLPIVCPAAQGDALDRMRSRPGRCLDVIEFHELPRIAASSIGGRVGATATIPFPYRATDCSWDI